MNNAEMQIREELFAMGDGEYRVFQQKLIPNIPLDRMIGVRTPALRRYAKQIKGSARAQQFLESLPHDYYDENNLHGALLDHIRGFDEALAAVERFLPYVDNWATCDMFCPKALLKDPARLWECIERWLTSGETYTVRYGLVRLTSWYMDELFTPAVLEAAAKVNLSDYYVRMAQAWLFSVALVKQYQAALPYLTEERLNVWVHNKAIQKAVESYRVPPETKQFLKTLKRQGEKNA